MEPSAVKISNLISKSNKADKRFIWNPGHGNIKLYEEPNIAARKVIIETSIVKHFFFSSLVDVPEV